MTTIEPPAKEPGVRTVEPVADATQIVPPATQAQETKSDYSTREIAAYLRSEASSGLIASIQSATKTTLLDIADDVHKFEVQADVIDKIDGQFPCLHSGNSSIVMSLLPADYEQMTASELQQYVLRRRDRSRDSGSRDLTTNVHYVDLEAADILFTAALNRFVAVRTAPQSPGKSTLRRAVAYLRGLPRSNSPEGPGSPFTVTTKSRALRVFVSPAYFLDPHTVFGGTLTSPVTGWLRAGLYVFGTRAEGDATTTFILNEEFEVPLMNEAELQA